MLRTWKPLGWNILCFFFVHKTTELVTFAINCMSPRSLSAAFNYNARKWHVNRWVYSTESNYLWAKKKLFKLFVYIFALLCPAIIHCRRCGVEISSHKDLTEFHTNSNYYLFCAIRHSLSLIFCLFYPLFSLPHRTTPQPIITSTLRIHDTCGVHNLHGMPAIISAIFSAIYATLATADTYKGSLTDIFPGMAWKNATNENGTIISSVSIWNWVRWLLNPFLPN